MPNQVRIIRERNSAQWDDLVREVINAGAYAKEHDYFGITTQERADKVRRCIRTAGKHLGVGSKVFYHPCPSPGNCRLGGNDCAFHVNYTIYDLDAARTYKAAQTPRQQPRSRR